MSFRQRGAALLLLMTAAISSAALVTGCSHASDQSTPAAAGTAATASTPPQAAVPGAVSAQRVQADEANVQNNSKLNAAQKKIMLDELSHAPTTGNAPK